MVQLTSYAPSAAFYLFAMAAQVSGLTSSAVAATLAAIATCLLAIPACQWLNKRGWQLRLPGKRMMPLGEAARIAYERTLGGEFSRSAEKFDGTSEGVLRYYAFHIIAKVKLFGSRPPSTVIEEINENMIHPSYLKLELRNGLLVGSHVHTGARFTNLQISKSDLKEAIGRVREIDKSVS